MMKITEELKNLREKDAKSLITEIEVIHKKRTDLCIQNSFGKAKNVKEIGLLRRKIARIRTVLQEKALEKLETLEVKNGN